MPSSETTRWNDWKNQKHEDYFLSCDKDFEDWYGPVGVLDDMNEGARRRISIEGFDEHSLDRSIDQWLEEDFDYMASNPFMGSERYAIGYIRVRGKSDTTMPETAGHYNAAVRRVYYDQENADQEYALQKYVRENRYIKFHTFPEFQSSSRTKQDPFFWLKFAISLCKKNRAALVYCELGSIFKHPTFFSIIKNAKNHGVSILAVKNLKALESAQRQIGKRKIFPKKKASRRVRQKARAIALERHPILAWKEKNKISAKLFKTFEHLYYGADPIYKFFLTADTMDEFNPSNWEPAEESNNLISNALHDAGYLTVEGYGWNKQLVRQTRHKIASERFHSYCKTKFMIEDGWEYNEPVSSDEVDILKSVSNPPHDI